MRKRSILASGCLSAFVLLMLALPAHATQRSMFKGVSSKLVVKAAPSKVYGAIRALRESDSEGVRILSATEHESVIEELFDELPIIGHARCVYKETYTPEKRIDYHMVESDHFKAFEGAWVLTPASDGSQTTLELSSYIDTGLPVPFARQITNSQTLKDVEQRLQLVKKLAEGSQHQISSARQKSD